MILFESKVLLKERSRSTFCDRQVVAGRRQWKHEYESEFTERNCEQEFIFMAEYSTLTVGFEIRHRL